MKVDYITHSGDDLTIVNAARVSFDKESGWEENVVGLNPATYLLELSERDEKLVKYLAKHKHFSPFNHTFITLRVKAPLFVARQLVKHEYMPWNEVSRRYVNSDPEFYELDWREKPAENIKQGSGNEIELDTDTEIMVSEAQSASLRAYKHLLGMGVAAEQARALLPQNMYTEWYWSGTLKAWAKMYQLRIDAHSQKETQKVAKMCGDIIQPHFPIAWNALIQSEL